MTLMLVGPSLMEVWTDGGLLDLIENTPANYAEWVRCCCNTPFICCPCQDYVDLMDRDPEVTVEGCGPTQTLTLRGRQLTGAQCQGWDVGYAEGYPTFDALAGGFNVWFDCKDGDPSTVILKEATYDLGAAVCSLGPPVLASWSCSECEFVGVIHREIIAVTEDCPCNPGPLIVTVRWTRSTAPCI